MLILTYLGIIFFSCAQSVTVKLYNNKQNTDSFAFNTIKAMVIFVLFLLLSVGNFDMNTETVFFSVAYGISLSISMYAGYKALKSGPVSLTSLIVSFSLILPCVYGIVVFNEPVTIIKIIGFVLLAISLFLTNAKSDNVGKASKKWMLFVFMTLFANGICSIIQKEHQTRYPGQFLTEFICIAMLASTVLFIFAMIYNKKIKISKTTLFYGTLSGVTNGGANFLTLFLSGLENASVLFPIVSAGNIVASVIAGKTIFREKNSILKYLAIFFGIFAVILLKL